MSATDLAAWVLAKSARSLTHLKLQKLCFYSYGAALAFDFADEIGEVVFEPWEHGPVSRPVWHRFRELGSAEIPRPKEVPTYSAQAEEHLGDVLRIYGRLSAWELREQSHLEAPWVEAFKQHAASIDREALRAHFRRKFKTDVQWPEALLRSASYSLDGVPLARYSDLRALADAVDHTLSK